MVYFCAKKWLHLYVFEFKSPELGTWKDNSMMKSFILFHIMQNVSN